MDFTNVIYIAYAFSNDLDFMYHHAAGRDFDNIRNISYELKQELFDEINDLTDIATLMNQSVDNFNNVKSHLDFSTEWSSTTNQIINMDTFIKEVKEKGSKYIKSIIESDLLEPFRSNYIKFWTLEILFKNEMRGLD